MLVPGDWPSHHTLHDEAIVSARLAALPGGPSSATRNTTLP